MTAHTPTLIAAASRCVRAAWKGNFRYVKAGVILDDLCLVEDAPRTLFDLPSPRAAAGMAAMDDLNAGFGRGTVFLAAIGIERAWRLHAAHYCPCLYHAHDRIADCAGMR